MNPRSNPHPWVLVLTAVLLAGVGGVVWSVGFASDPAAAPVGGSGERVDATRHEDSASARTETGGGAVGGQGCSSCERG